MSNHPVNSDASVPLKVCWSQQRGFVSLNLRSMNRWSSMDRRCVSDALYVNKVGKIIMYYISSVSVITLTYCWFLVPVASFHQLLSV